MISISRSFKILIIDDNETDMKVVQRLISKDYKSVDVTARSGVSDWKIFLEGNKFDLILLNYAAGSSVGLQEIKKIIAVNDTIPVYIMIWQHEVEVGMKAIYQGAEGFVIKDKTYLNLKKIIQRSLLNYLIFSELNSLREINDIISEEVNDGFFRFSKEGDLEYISDKFASLLGFDSEFETGTIYSDLFKEIKEHIKSSADYEREISFSFETTGKNDKTFWFQVYVYKKIDIRNDTLYYEGVLKNTSEKRNLDLIIKNLKDEKDLLLNSTPLPVEVYSKDGKKLSSNPAFTKMLNGFDVSIKDPLSKAPEYQTLKENLLKAAEVSAISTNSQKITFGNKEKYFDINYIASKGNSDTIFAFYNDISENVKYRKIIADINNRKSALYHSIDTGFIELDAAGNITDISEKALVILGKGISDYTGTHFSELLTDSGMAKSALAESKKNGRYDFIINGTVKASAQIIKNPAGETDGFIVSVEDIGKILETEEAFKSNAEKVSYFSNIDNIFLWTGNISGNTIKPEYCSRAVEKITGYTIQEAIDADSFLIEFLFNQKENNTKDKLLKLFKENTEREITIKDKKGEFKRIKIRTNIQKESKDNYKVSVLVEDITVISALKDSYSGVASAANFIIKNEESAFIRLDDTLVVKDIFSAPESFSNDIKTGQPLPEIANFKDFSLTEAALKAIRENLTSESCISTEEPTRKFKLLMLPFQNFADEKYLYLYIKDITKQEELSGDYDYLSRVIDNLKEFDSAFFLILENDNIRFANYGFETLTGYKKDEITKKQFKEFFADQSCFDDFQKQLKLLRKKNRLDLIIKLKDKSSSDKYCHFNCSVLQTEGAPDRLLLLGNDETEKENLKNEIKYKIEFDKILSASVEDSIMAWSNDSIIYHNNEAENVFGYNEKELLSLDRQDLFSPIQDGDIKEQIPHLFDESFYDTFNGKPVEVICKKKHGQEFFAEATIYHHQLQAEKAVILLIRDITEKKNLQKAIFNIDNRFRGVIDSLNEGIWLFDSEYKTVFISNPILFFLDYTIDEIHEKRIFYFMKDSGFEFDKRYFEESSSAKYNNVTLSFIKKDNELFQSKVNIVPLRDEKGAFLGGILSLTDLTEITGKDSEINNLKVLNSGLEKKVRNLDSDLRHAKKLISDYKKETENLILELEAKINSSKSVIDELDGKSKHINRLYHVIQSNLRSQISNIVGFAGFLEEVWDKLNPQQQKTYISILLNNAKQGYKIFDKISLFAKIGSENFKIKTGIVNLSSSIEELLTQQNEKISAKKISIKCEITENQKLNGDKALIELVLDELISNAVKYSQPGAPLNVSLQPVHDKLILTIQNSGDGISFDKQQKLFNLDEAPASSANGEIGSGLSLLIVKEIIKAHNGSIEVSSEEGKGTKVCVLLPAAGNVVFLVGSETDCEILNSFIKNSSNGYTAQSYFDTDSAINNLVGNPIAIFATYSQPDEKFFGFLNKLASHDCAKTLPVVTMSSDLSDGFKIKLLKYGVSTFISLPLSEKNIREAFDSIMS
jgi:PAS domain S-box-containing protein